MGVRNVVRQCLPFGFLPFTWAYQSWRPAIRILMYHRVTDLAAYDQLTVTPSQFDQQLRYLKRHHRVISLAEAVKELQSGRVTSAGVVITFDDGYRDNLEHALPLLQKHQLPATIFVTARFCAQTQKHPRYQQEQGRLHLSWDETRQLANSPGIVIGSHTLTHPFLSRLNEQQARAEIADSRDEIAQQIGKAVDYFCYPAGDFTERETAMVMDAGYQAAVSVAPGRNHDWQAPFSLYRTEITDRDDAQQLALKLAGAYDPIHHWLHQQRLRRFAAQRHSAQLNQAMESK